MRYQRQMRQLLIGHDVGAGEVPHINDVGLSELIHPWESIVADFKVADRSPRQLGEPARNKQLTA
jgi:hypothetical protein